MNPSVGVHILPFWESEGDGGFAVSSWQAMDSQYGTFEDIRFIARRRRVVLDGIYNHVGWRHPIAAQFLEDPATNAYLLHTVDDTTPPPLPLAPRGGGVYRTHYIGERVCQIWQTFGSEMVDVNLANDSVMQQVRENLRLLASLGAYGVRLDALPYYGKSGTRSPLHNPDGIEAARVIVDQARALGLDPILQLDCDHDLGRYASLERFNPAVIDFSFDTCILYAFLTQDVAELRKHLESTRDSVGVRIHRPIRTHDGVLLRSGNQPEAFVAKVVEVFRQSGFRLRFANGTPYEVNNSLPYLLGAQVSASDYYRKLVLATVIGVLTSDATYIYLGGVLGDIPESDQEFGEDPRELQRRPIPLSALRALPWADAQEARRQINELADLSMSAEVRGLPRTMYDVSDRDGVLTVANSTLGLAASLNFTSRSARASLEKRSVLSSGCVNGIIEPYGFDLYRID